MDNLPLQALIPIGVVTAALIAGFFSLLNLIISKEQKVSEFRQQWIDSLRQELSDHMAALVSLSSILEDGNSKDKESLKIESDLRQKIASTFISIKLRINPEDSNEKIRTINKNVLRLLDEERGLFNESKFKAARLKCNEITTASIPMLKEEWGRVKKGEDVYVWTRRMAIALFTASLFSLLYLSFKYWPSPEQSVATIYISPENVHKDEPQNENKIGEKIIPPSEPEPEPVPDSEEKP
jgi:hypothetical protein